MRLGYGILFLILALAPVAIAIYAIILLRETKDTTERILEALVDLREIVRQR